jgi:hypothetical protein
MDSNFIESASNSLNQINSLIPTYIIFDIIVSFMTVKDEKGENMSIGGVTMGTRKIFERLRGKIFFFLCIK